MTQRTPPRSRIASAGFTLIELLVVITIIGLLAAALLPRVLEAMSTANIAADSANLRWHYSGLTEYRARMKKSSSLAWPAEGGHKVLFAPWIKRIHAHTDQNRNRYFSPKRSETRVEGDFNAYMDLPPDEIWQSYEDVTSEMTDYAGRAAEHYRTMWNANQALAALDNELGAMYEDGATVVLLSDGSTKELRKDEIEEYWSEDFLTTGIPVGPDSPVPMLQTLRY